MALIDLKSNLSNFRSDFSHEGKLVSPVDISKNIQKDIQKVSPVKPIAPVTKDKVSVVKPKQSIFKDKTSLIQPEKTIIKDKISKLNPLHPGIKSKESLTQPSSPKDLAKKSLSSIPGTVNYFNDVKSGAKGFELKASDRNNSSYLGVKGTTYNHAVPGSVIAKFTQSPKLKEKKSPINIPGTVNYFDDVKAGAKGFILKASDRNQSSYLGVKGQTYKHAVPGSGLANFTQAPDLIPKESPKSIPYTVNYFNDIKSGAKGFQLNANDRNQSSYLGVKGAVYNHAVPGSVLAKLGTVNYFDDVKSGAKGFILNANNRNNSSYLGIEGAVYNHAVPGSVLAKLGTVNYFNDVKSGAKGFILNANNRNNSNFSGINGTTYTHAVPGSVIAKLGTVNYFNDVKSGATGFQLKASDRNQSSYLGISGTTYTHAVPGSILTKLGTVNYFDDVKSGAKGFILKASDRNQSNFSGISGTTYNHAKAVPGSVIAKLGAVNYFDDVQWGASGFQLKANDRNKSNFLGINGSIYNHAGPNKKIATLGAVNYFDDVQWGASGFILKANDRTKSNFLGISGTTYNHAGPNKKIATLGTVNYFDDVKSGATGFILKASDKTKSSFSGISGTTYNHPKLPFHILQVGNASLDNQLPDGSIFRYLKSGASTIKKFSDKGYNDKNKYGNVIQSVKGQPNKSLLYTKSTESNSPSALDAEYKKFNLRDDAYNPGYMKHPLVLRDIGKRWGSPFDDGLIRGGMITAVERAAMDTVRIAKWVASPRGLLWIVKQVGLGMTNPRVEGSMSSLLGRPSRIHSGITSLLSVAGTAFGLHFTTHGIPIVNALSNYETVINARNSMDGENYYIKMKEPDTYALGKAQGNRLLKLRKDLLPRVKPKPGEKKEFGKFMSVVKSVVAKLKSISGHAGAKIDILSGLGGPGSVYGIGSTTIHRYVISDEKAIAQAAKQNWNTKYTYHNQYATLGVITVHRSSVGGPETSDTPSLNAHGIDELKDSLWTTMTTFGEKDNGAPGTNNTTHPSQPKYVNLESGDGRASSFPKAKNAGIKSYATVAYNLLKRDDAKSFQDFRNDVKAQKDSSEKSYVGKPKDKEYYKTNNLETYYGFGKVGMIKADRSDPNKFLITDVKGLGQLYNHKNFRGDSVNALDIDNKSTDKIYPKGAKDLIKFYFQDGNQGNNVMPFRCTMTGFTDNFSPSWNRIDIMGRPDGAYLYSSFERSVSFNFIVAAMSRSEMIPMWRKINYLATYTMPDLSGNKKPSGPMMRITIVSRNSWIHNFIVIYHSRRCYMGHSRR